ncbi:MAG: HNH endonuclease [Clostridia bacterium]|nr:HNH endonuclease [Clostridia bacterium]
MRAAFREKPKTGISWMATHRRARQLLPSGCCEKCGSNQNVDVHHKDGNPLNNSLDNLQRLCRSCHTKIHRRQKTCLICGAKAKGYGYCNKHYIRYKKYGNPLWVNGREEVVQQQA